jgi:hypothetical protein
VSNLYKDSRDQILWRDYVTTNGNVINDTVSMGLYPSNTYIDVMKSWFAFDAFGAGVLVNIGDATYPAGIRANWGVPALGVSRLYPQGGLADSMLKTALWQKLGYPADPGGNLELLAQFVGANPANGSFSWQIFGRKG